MRALLFFVLLIVVVCAGCKKCGQRVLPQSVKPFLFKTGSFWVFQNESSLELDTFFLTNQISGVEAAAERNRMNCYHEEVYKMDFVSSSNRSFTIICRGNSLLFLNLQSQPKDLSGYIYDSNNQNEYCSDYSICKLNAYYNLSIAGYTFPKVDEISAIISDQSFGGYRVETNIFWAPQIGVVKFVLHDAQNTTMNLIDWSIIL